MKFTPLQKEEILHKITVREETIEEDPASGSEFELSPGSLERLRRKVQSDRFDFEFDEAQWLREELTNAEDIAWSHHRNLGIGALSFARSMGNACDKLTHS